MNPEQIDLVRRSFTRIAPIADQAAGLFYRRLFELDPSLRRLFRGDMAMQRKKLMAALGVVVSVLDRLEPIAPMLRALGRRYASYGVETEHYAIVCEALIWTLEQGLGDDFTPEVEAAWIDAYNTLAWAMVAGAEDDLTTQQAA